MNDRTLSPGWFVMWMIELAGVGYFTDGRLGAVEGPVIAVVLAHGALLEVLREERKQSEKSDGEF
jgi:hypothetical protein